MFGLRMKVGTGPFNWVGGKRAPVSCPRTYDNLEPRTGKLLCKVGISDEKDVNSAVECAAKAFPTWRATPAAERGSILERAASILREKTEELAKLDVLDNGKPIWEARLDMESVIGALEYYGAFAKNGIRGEYYKLAGGSFAYVSKEPLGVIGGIGAWNYPLQTATWKVAPALACGNTFVYKPSQFTPLTAIKLGEILKESGLPDGVFNVIQGEGETGALLSNHRSVAKLSFTGSLETGVKIMKAGAEGIRPVTLELGGKSPLIIFNDADLTNSVKGALMANFFSQGQVCSNGTRIFVQRNIYDSFMKDFVNQVQKLRIGDPFDEKTTVGATIHKDHAERILKYVKGAIEEGGTVETGGKLITLEGDLAGGYYISPCILTKVHDDMKAVKEEIFGPVAAVLVFDTEEEVIRRANNTPFGLAAGVFTKDLTRAHHVADSIDAGVVWINTFNICSPQVPFGGYKMSGIGRENGTAAIEFYTQTKTVHVEGGDIDCGLLYDD